MTGQLRILRAAALYAISFLVAASAAASFSESYRALYVWALSHGLDGIWAAAFPLQVDVFIAIGELALFVALADGWAPRSRIAAWTVTALGLAVSVAGNVGHVHGDLASRGTAAVPPLAAAASLAVGLGVFKRVVAGHQPHPVLREVVTAIEEMPGHDFRRHMQLRHPGSPLSPQAHEADHRTHTSHFHGHAAEAGHAPLAEEEGVPSAALGRP